MKPFINLCATSVKRKDKYIYPIFLHFFKKNQGFIEYIYLVWEGKKNTCDELATCPASFPSTAGDMHQSIH